MAPEALQALIDRKAPVIIIDVRDQAQFAEETIKGAVHIPFADLEARLKDVAEGHDPGVHLKYRQEELAGCEARGTGRVQDSGVLSSQGVEAEGLRNGARQEIIR